MIPYVGVVPMFAILGSYAFLLFRWWFRHLTALAVRYDIAERRRRASWRYPLVLILLMAPALAVLFAAMSLLGRSHGLVIALLLIGSLAPASVWWGQRMPSLRALGYGRQLS